MIGDLFPSEKRARALGFFMMGLPVGNIAAFALAGAIGLLDKRRLHNTERNWIVTDPLGAANRFTVPIAAATAAA